MLPYSGRILKNKGLVRVEEDSVLGKDEKRA
jgi:hypothetical protein